jgi:AraC-like DNA-binding protein
MPLMDDETFRRLCRARDFAGANFREQLRLEDLAKHACLSPFHFQRLYKAAFGESPHSFLSKLRIDRAKQMLALDHMSVTEVCMVSGYSSLGTFSSKFQAVVGQSPSEYRRRLRNVFAVPGWAWGLWVPSCFMDFYGRS